MRRILPIALLLLASLAAAQVRGVPASVTSPGKYSAEPRGVPASVTSLGPGGYHDLGLTPFPTHLDCQGATCFPTTYPPIHTRAPRYPIFYPIYYPTYSQPPVIIINTAPPAAAADAQYDEAPPAPTIFERRPRTRPYARDEHRYDEDDAATAEPARREPAVRRDQQISAIAPEESTVFVLLDGTQLELHNFAIVGDFVWNFDAEGPRKILLAQLDLEQTLKLNADRGTDLRLPHR